MGIVHSGPRNPNWRGGRSVASNGYVLVRVGTAHHLADYAYEHRIVAEKILGRRLRKGEEPHHKNGVRTDNRRRNIKIMRSRLHHGVEHRTARFDKRLPGQPNLLVSCECGCGSQFRRFDRWRRPRRYVSGHNMRGR